MRLLNRLLLVVLAAQSLFGTTAASNYAATIMAESSLVGYWRLGDSTSTSVDSKNGYNATNNASGLGVSGPLLYDSTPNTAWASSAGAVLANTGSPTDSSHFDFEYNQAFSVEFWIRFGANAVLNTGIQLDAVGNRQNGGANKGWKVWFYGGTGVEQLRFLMEAANGSNYVENIWTTTSFVKYQWYHIVVTNAGTHLGAGIKAYVNGVLQAVTVNHDALGANTTVTSLPLYLGSSGSGANAVTATLDEMSIYNSELTQAQVLAHLGSSSYPRGLQTIPPCNGTAQKVIIDSDPGSDTDDYEDQGMWLALAKLGCLNVVGHSIQQLQTYGAASGKLLSIHAGQTGIPYGAYKGSNGGGAQIDFYATAVATLFNYLIPRSSFTTATTALRGWLSAAASNSIIMIATGPATNLSDLLNTADGDDGISGSGITLVTNKVSALYWVAGYWPTGSSESNWLTDPTATTNLFAKWPAAVPVVMFGIPLGNQISLGAATWQTSDNSLTNVAVASNVATATVPGGHGLRTGDLIELTGSTTQVTLNSTTRARNSTSTLTNIVVAGAGDPRTATVTTSAAHFVAVGDRVSFSGSATTALDDSFTVLTTPSSTTFTFQTTGIAAATYTTGLIMRDPFRVTVTGPTTFTFQTSAADGTNTDTALAVLGGLQPYTNVLSSPVPWSLYNTTNSPPSGSANRINWSGIALLSAAYGFSNVMAYGGSGGTICSKTSACSVDCGNDVVGSSAACYGWESTPNHGRAYAAFLWNAGTYQEFLDRLLKRELHMPWIMPQ